MTLSVIGTAPHPFLKWAGGKGKLLGELLARIEFAGRFEGYFEPFLGGGALFFEMARLGRLPSRVVLSDANPNLVEAYQAVRDDVEGVIQLLHGHRDRHSRDYYYAVRAEVPASRTGRAARIVYLNRTCFNGLYRENSRGLFNVPFGKYTNPRICDEDNLRACSKVLAGAEVAPRSFEGVLDVARPGDLVYFDPPYHPLSKTASFTAYSRDRFGEESQRRLADVFGELSKRGVKALLSNSATDLVRELYGDFMVEEVLAARSVNRDAGGRGKIAEVLVRNF